MQLRHNYRNDSSFLSLQVIFDTVQQQRMLVRAI